MPTTPHPSHNRGDKEIFQEMMSVLTLHDGELSAPEGKDLLATLGGELAEKPGEIMPPNAVLGAILHGYERGKIGYGTSLAEDGIGQRVNSIRVIPAEQKLDA